MSVTKDVALLPAEVRQYNRTGTQMQSVQDRIPHHEAPQSCTGARTFGCVRNMEDEASCTHAHMFLLVSERVFLQIYSRLDASASDVHHHRWDIDASRDRELAFYGTRDVNITNHA